MPPKERPAALCEASGPGNDQAGWPITPEATTDACQGRGEVVARHIPGIAAAIARTAETVRNDGLLAFALRGHAGELLDAADLIDRPWAVRARDLLWRLRLGERVTMGGLTAALAGYLDGADTVKARLVEIERDTGLKGREAVAYLLGEAADD